MNVCSLAGKTSLSMSMSKAAAMKRPKKLTYEQKRKLSHKGFDPNEYRYVTEDEQALCFVHKETGENIWIEK